MDYYIHDTPGRLRIESPVLKNNEAHAQTFEAFVKGIPGVASVEMKVDIGSATIHYDRTRIDHLKAKTLDDRIEAGVEEVANVVITAVTEGVE